MKQHTLTSPRSPQRLYYASRLTSQMGQGVFFALLLVVVGPGSAGALGLGGVMLAMTVAAMALGPLGGSLVDRLGPRLALPAGAALRLLAVGCAVALVGHGEYAWLVAFVYSAASQVFSPAELALVSTLRRERAAGTHASLFVLQYGGQAIGALALAPALFWLGGVGAMLGGALVVYLAVTVLALNLGARLDHTVEGAARPPRTAPQTGMSFASTLRFFANEPQALYAVGLLAFVDVTTRGLMIAAPIYLQSELHLARGQIVMLMVAGACGVVFGLGWAARWITPRQAPTMMRVVLAALLVSMFALTPLGDGLATLTVSGVAFRFGGVAEPVLVGTLAAVPAVFILGTALGAVPTIARSVLTATAPAGQQGRVFAAESVLSNALLVPSLLLVALSTDLVSARATMMLIGLIGLAVFALLEYRALRRLAAAPLTVVAPAATAMPEPDAV